MRVIFLEDVPGTADAGEVKEVKNGFARNYLLPRLLAAPATTDQLQRLRSIQRAAEEKRVKLSQDMAQVAQALNDTTVTVKARVGPTGQLYGTITARHVAEALTKQTGRPLDHRDVLMAEAIRAPGEYPTTIRLYRDVTAQVIVSVMPEGSAEEQAAGELTTDTEAPMAQAEEATAELEEPVAQTEEAVAEPEEPVADADEESSEDESPPRKSDED